MATACFARLRRNGQVDALIGELKQKLSETLSPRQMQRLDEVTLRALGIQGLLETSVADRLKLSSVQTQKIRAGLGAMNSELASIQRNSVNTGDMTAVWTYKNQAERDILAVLSSSQRNLLGTMMGRPFDFSAVESIACRARRFATSRRGSTPSH